MENPPFEDVSPIQDGDFPIAMFVYRRVIYESMAYKPIQGHHITTAKP